MKVSRAEDLAAKSKRKMKNRPSSYKGLLLTAMSVRENFKTKFPNASRSALESEECLPEDV